MAVYFGGKMPIDYKLYPKDWKTRIVPAVINRAGNCCENCQVPNASMQWRGRKKVYDGKRWKNRVFHYQNEQAALDDGCNHYGVTDITASRKAGRSITKDIGIYQTKIVLTVAHLDHDELNHDVKLDRLKALCQLCHLQMDAAEKYRRATTGYYKERNLNND